MSKVTTQTKLSHLKVFLLQSNNKAKPTSQKKLVQKAPTSAIPSSRIHLLLSTQSRSKDFFKEGRKWILIRLLAQSVLSKDLNRLCNAAKRQRLLRKWVSFPFVKLISCRFYSRRLTGRINQLRNKRSL